MLTEVKKVRFDIELIVAELQALSEKKALKKL